MQLKEGWLVGVKHLPSPHCDGRPEEENPSLLVVHNISLPPGSSVAHGLMRYLPERSILQRILTLPVFRICACRHIV